MEAVEIQKPPPISVMVTEAVFPQQLPEQAVVRTDLDIQEASPDLRVIAQRNHLSPIYRKTRLHIALYNRLTWTGILQSDRLLSETNYQSTIIIR